MAGGSVGGIRASVGREEGVQVVIVGTPVWAPDGAETIVGDDVANAWEVPADASSTAGESPTGRDIGGEDTIV